MRKAVNRPPTIQLVGLTERRRVVLEPESVFVEVTSIAGGYHPEQEIYYDEIRAVYEWLAPNWSLVVWGLFAGLLGGLIAAVSAGSSPAAGWVGLAAGLAILAGFVVLALTRGRTHWLKIDGAGRELKLATNDRRFREALYARVPDAPEPGSPPPAPLNGFDLSAEPPPGAAPDGSA
jgi:hypothetical protein